jgi:3-oxoacyl-[acyl-carrier protein] reductase
MRLAPEPGRRIVIVGACGGIGAAVTAALLDADCCVAALDLPASLERAPPPDGIAFAEPIDGRDPASVAAAFAALGQRWSAIDGLVVASGFAGPRQPLADTPIAAIDEVLAGNLRLTALVLQAAAPLIGHGIDSAVVLLSSDMAYAPQPGYAPYVAAKAGIVALGRSVAREWAPAVRVNIVSPGAVDTPFLRGGMGRAAILDAPLRFDMAAYLAQVPLGRLAFASDIVGPVLFLLGPASRYITGEVTHVSGGAVMA